MGTLTSTNESQIPSPIFLQNQHEALCKDGHQNLHRLVLHDFNDGEQFEGVNFL